MLYPKIGVPMFPRHPIGRLMQYSYDHCLKRAQAAMWILKWTPYTQEKLIETALETCDGFLFPGGPDIGAEFYGQASLSGGRATDSERDAFELALLRAVLEAEKPIFCIGRGMQLLNVIYGGTLLQNMKSKQEYPHYDIWHLTTATHPVELDSYSLLSDILHTDTLSVNSLHHQTVENVGEGLLAVSDSPEGFAEALEIEAYPFCLAVQWRPEYMALRAPEQQRLFQAFVDACRI